LDAAGQTDGWTEERGQRQREREREREIEGDEDR